MADGRIAIHKFGKSGLKFWSAQNVYVVFNIWKKIILLEQNYILNLLYTIK